MLDNLNVSLEASPPSWKDACMHTELRLHQLSPFIGKLKSTIAESLILRHSVEGDLIADPFAGAGTVPLEALKLGRNAFAADCSEYSRVLTKAKMNPPQDVDRARKKIKKIK